MVAQHRAWTLQQMTLPLFPGVIPALNRAAVLTLYQSVHIDISLIRSQISAPGYITQGLQIRLIRKDPVHSTGKPSPA
jgi:hypothetical protein